MFVLWEHIYLLIRLSTFFRHAQLSRIHKKAYIHFFTMLLKSHKICSELSYKYNKVFEVCQGQVYRLNLRKIGSMRS